MRWYLFSHHGEEHENPSEQGRKSARLLNTSLCSLNRLLRKLQEQSDDMKTLESRQGGCLDESERRSEASAPSGGSAFGC